MPLVTNAGRASAKRRAVKRAGGGNGSANLKTTRLDPTRTVMMRKALTAEMRRRFARLKALVVKLVVDEDAFGADARRDPKYDTLNAFCPTGEGGGVDPSCSPGGSSQGTISIVDTDKKTLDKVKKISGMPPDKMALLAGIVGGKSTAQFEVHGNIVSVNIIHDDYYAIRHFDFENKTVQNESIRVTTESKGVGTEVFASQVDECVKAGFEKIECRASREEGLNGYYTWARLGYDGDVKGPRGTTRVSELMKNEEDRKWWKENGKGFNAVFDLRENSLSRRVLDAYRRTRSRATANTKSGRGGRLGFDMGRYRKITTNAGRWYGQPDREKVRLFAEWLKRQIGQIVAGKTARDILKRYALEGMKKGAGRAFDDVRKREKFLGMEDKEKLDFYQGSRDQFLRESFRQPVSVQRVEALAGRSYDDLENITTDMSARMGRTLLDGLVQGKGAEELATDLADQVDIGRTRAEVIARTEVIRAHAEGQLTAMEEMGVEEVGVAVEWVTAQDDKVCPKCEALEGVVLKISEARGMLPRHPSCRCAWLPAGLGEDTTDQIDTKRGIRAALEEAGEDEDWGPDVAISRDRPEGIFNMTMEDVYNAFCPTGEGGGVDPSCSPSSSGTLSKDTVVAGKLKEIVDKPPPLRVNKRLLKELEDAGDDVQKLLESRDITESDVFTNYDKVSEKVTAMVMRRSDKEGMIGDENAEDYAEKLLERMYPIKDILSKYRSSNAYGD